MPSFLLKVENDFAGERLDVFLFGRSDKIPSRSYVKKIIEDQQVLVNGRIQKCHYHVHSGDLIEVHLKEEFCVHLRPEPMSLDVFYEDGDLLVINKPVGLMVHPAQGIMTGTLVNGLLHHCRRLSDINGALRPGIVHRLDKETSGLLVTAKTNAAHVALARQFERRLVCKCYLALVKGLIEFDEGQIDVELGRHRKHPQKRAVFGLNAKAAVTVYRVIKRFDDTTLVNLFPKTGRTHQLRVHLNHIGHPIMGDYKYGRHNVFDRLALHARYLSFRHPKTLHVLGFSTRLPEFCHW